MSDDDIRSLSRLAGDGDVEAAEMLLAALKRSQGVPNVRGGLIRPTADMTLGGPRVFAEEVTICFAPGDPACRISAAPGVTFYLGPQRSLPGGWIRPADGGPASVCLVGLIDIRRDGGPPETFWSTVSLSGAWVIDS